MDAPLSQVGLFGGAVESFAQQFPAVQKQTEAIRHILPRRTAAAPTRPPTADPPFAHRRCRPSEASSAPAKTSSSKGAAPSPGGGPGGESFVCFCFCSATCHSPLTLPFDGSRYMLHHILCRYAVRVGSLHSTALPHPGYICGAVGPACTVSGSLAVLPSPTRWLIRTIRLGYRIQFAWRPPAFRGIQFTHVLADNAPVLRAEIAVPLAKDAIEPVPPAEMKTGFYSPRKAVDHRNPISILPRHRPFLRFAFEGRAYQYKVLPFGQALSPRVFTKVAGAAIAPMCKRGVRILNYPVERAVVQTQGQGVVPPALYGPSNVEQTFEEIQFQNVTQGSLARAIKQNDWFTSVDLKDAFFHISIYPPHRKYLRLAYQGICYEFTVLPFGRNLSPRTFCLCAEAGMAPLRLSGLRILNYIYDWFIIAKSKEKVSLDTGRVLAHITSLGFKVNASKNNLTPSQNVFFLGLELNSVSLRARLSQERVRSLMNCLTQFREGARVQYRTCLRLQGLMASSIQVVPLGLLRMRAFTKWVLSLHFSPIRDLCRSVTVTRACSAALRHWESENFTLGEPPWDGYDAESCDDRCVLNRLGNHPGRQNGERSVAEQTTFSAHELFRAFTIWKALNHFLPRLQGHPVLVRCDNTTAVAYINRQGGMRSSKLHALAYRLLVWSRRVFLSLRVTHVRAF
ncbi:hypothetical protein PO909_015189 [Leuciscus waleckii]